MPRKKKKYHFIYKTTNLLSNRYYIGMHSADNLEDGYLGSGNRLRLAIRKHGRENFKREILEFCESREELRKRESEVITLDEVAKKECMNLAVGGKGGFTDSGGPKAFAKKVKDDSKFREKILNNLFEGRDKAHAEGRIPIPDWTGKKHSEESKKLMSDKAKSRTGSKNSQFGTCWITKDGINKKIKKEELDQFLNLEWTKGRV